MKRLMLALAMAATASTAFAQALPVRVAPGAKWTFSVENDRKEVRDGARTSKKSSTVYVMTLNPKGQIVMVRLDGSMPPTTPVQKRLAETPLILEVDEGLRPTRLVNETEVRAATTDFVNELSIDQSPEARVQLLEIMQATLLSVVFREPQFMALSQGSDLKIGQTAAYTTELPNPLGGSPITSIGSYALRSYDAKAGRAVVEWRQGFEPNSVSASLREAAGKLFAGAAKGDRAEAETQLAGMVLDREDSCTHTIDIKSGLAVNAECLSEMRTALSGRVFTRTDRWTLSQTLPETP